MRNREAVIWLTHILADIGKAEHRNLWHYGQVLSEIKEMLETPQPEPCEDAVSRQAAIDAVSRGCLEFRGIFAECEKNLNELPPAEPDVTRCGKCTHKDKRIDYCHYLGITICECDYCSYAVRRTDDDGRD